MFADLSSSVFDASKAVSVVAAALAALVALYHKISPKREFKPWMVLPAVGLIAVCAGAFYFGPRILPRNAPAGFKLHEAEGYTAFYPGGWKVAEDDVLKTTYRRSKFVSPDGGYWLVVDRTPGEDTEPFDKAELGHKREVAARRPGYRKLTLHPVTLGSRQGTEWTFNQGGNHYAEYFLRVGGDGYAVAGSGYDFDAVKERARRLAKSIEPD